MSTATLNVWISAIGDPCHIVDGDHWFVHIVDCEGRVLRWCGREYRDIPAKCGHAEIQIPPGCYAVFAGHSRKGEGIPPFGNRLTHVQIVRANCGDHVCVNLFSPSLWFCGTWFRAALLHHLPDLQRTEIDPGTVRTAADAVQNLLDKLPAEPFADNLQAFQQEAGRDKR
jgi:hypothetical protein